MSKVHNFYCRNLAANNEVTLNQHEKLKKPKVHLCYLLKLLKLADIPTAKIKASEPRVVIEI